MAKSILRRFTKRFLIFVNILAAVFFLAGSYGYLLNPAYFWPVGLLTLTAFYFMLLLLGFVFFWLVIKPRLAFISVVALLLAYKPARNIIALRLPGPFAQAKPQNTIRVITWNVAQFNVMEDKKNPGVKKDMVDQVNYYQPDIACFQEMVAEDSAVKDHGHMDEFLEKLKFSNYFYSYNVKEDFWGYAHFGIIIFSKYPIINKQTISWYPNDYNSIFQFVDIVKGADTIRVFNIHLQTLRFSKANLKYIDQPTVEDQTAIRESKNIIGKFKKGFLKRRLQAERIRAEIEKSPYPVIVSGDFNDVPNSYAYYTIGKGMKNAFVEKGSGLGRTFSGISPVLRIDNIFVDDEMEVLQFNLIKKKLSDHFPIIADVQLVKK
ncbi:MAG TPA: endonuclease/exonuclease/phosphatase family protein [Ferruginibacter sp.]|nr:endonuclease/exonuclease/phosphatase family protein [Chitinophagaceae bacterium]MBK9532066.1 endonuclease/exonuclease/phosphatase family protein [Chitinophagaceae bacterium]HQW91623.1 endonuclease/exonuclease/phosphatase family protein [Ferruginibacter sp.]